MPCLAASCAAVSSPRSASSATFALKSAEYRVRLPVIRVRPSRRRTELTRLSEIRGPPQTSPPGSNALCVLVDLVEVARGGNAWMVPASDRALQHDIPAQDYDLLRC